MKRCVLCLALFVASVSAFAVGCGDDDAGGGLITLSTIVPDPVPVQVGVATGTLTFNFTNDPLDLSKSTDFQSLLTSGGINLSVASSDTGVSFALTEGTLVLSTPAAVGEYSVSASEDGTIVTVTFYNSFGGYSINAANTYTATIDVIDNGYFTVESFTRSVSIQ
jgi:hypothetical protein